jgi:ferredoxin
MPGCVGCGKCTRACPADMNLKEHLAEVAAIQDSVFPMGKS